MKNLGVGGDGGFISTNDPEVNRKLRLLRDHGQKSKEEIECFGFNSRLDNLHAALALVKMKYLHQGIERRRTLAARYQLALGEIEEIRLPMPPAEEDSPYYDVFSSYVVRTEQRQALMEHMREAGIEVFAHLSPPMHHQQGLGLGHWPLPVTERISKEVLSLPLYPELSDEDQQLVIQEVRAFFKP
jgi:dTDP-4-amino-4,6-dideoxygalactose transaminase